MYRRLLQPAESHPYSMLFRNYAAFPAVGSKSFISLASLTWKLIISCSELGDTITMREQNRSEDIHTFFSLNKMHLVNGPPVTKATRAGTHLTPATFQFWISRFSGIKLKGCLCGAHAPLHIV